MARAKQRKEYLFYLLTLVILIAGVLLWTHNLGSDPPAYFGNLGQSLATDPGHCVYHARNRAMFGDPDPFDFPRWIVIERSLTSLAAYLWFSVAGVSLKQAGMVGVLLSIGALLFFLLAVGATSRPWVSVAVAICYLANICLMVHGRLSLLENGLMFLTSLLFFVYSRWGDRLWGLVVSGLLVAAAVLTGKLFGILLLPALLLAVWICGGPTKRRNILAGGMAFATGATILFFTLYGSKLSSAYRYYVEGSYSLHGFPQGLTSPWAFFEHLVSYGGQNSLFRFSPDLLVFFWLGGFMLTYLIVSGKRFERLPRISVLSALVIAFLWLGLSPLNYSPLRYGVLLIPPAIILLFTLSDRSFENVQTDPSKNVSYAIFVLLLLVTWQALFHVAGMSFAFKTVSVRVVIWGMLPVAVAVTITIRHFFLERRTPFGRSFFCLLAAIALTLSITVNGYRIHTHLWNSSDSTIRSANTDLGCILGQGAVVAGPYAAVLTLENNLKSFIYYFGVAEADLDLLNRIPITHLAIDSTNWIEAVKLYPALQGEIPITTYHIRNYDVRIYDIADQFGLAEEKDYQRTGYERAAIYRNQQKYPEAYAEITGFVKKHPTCWSANLVLVELLMRAQQFDRAATLLEALASRHADDYYTNLICGRSFQVMGIHAGDNRLLARAQRHYEKAAGDDPLKAENVWLVYQATMRQLNADSGSARDEP
ncbi:MAG: hypothetical protein JSV52_08765 [Candidatus Zixiibacteriota bacterium]|nr:MAG: hypothetical protein JSV52_08765 [candidate division Zixibacteria bacterium]